MKTKVIVISGITAGGKTTLVRTLSQRFPQSACLAFDDYSIDAMDSAPPIDTPISEAVDRYDIELLMQDLRKIYGRFPLLLIDFPFGSKHKQLRPFIDGVVYIQTPLDIAFARSIIRDFSLKTQAEIIEWAKIYLEFARPIFLDHEKTISETADLIINGEEELSEQVLKVEEYFQLN